MARISGARGWMPVSVALAFALVLASASCRIPFTHRKSVQPERSQEMGLEGPVEVAVRSPAWSTNGVVRVSGSATNFTRVALATCSVGLRLLDHNGALVSVTTAYTLSGLEPGEKWEFEVKATGVPITDRFYDVEVGSVLVKPK